jgi:hypothetical protein
MFLSLLLDAYVSSRALSLDRERLYLSCIGAPLGDATPQDI